MAPIAPARAGKARPKAVFDVSTVWKRVTPELEAELLDFWQRHHAIGDRARARQRVPQAVCIARDEAGDVCAVSTAVVRVLPRIGEPLYYFRLFFAKAVRGQGQVVPMFNRARAVLQDYNASLPQPESIGMLVELESRHLSAEHRRAHVDEGDSYFVGYSLRGLQLRVSYFQGALLTNATRAGQGG
ncbi:MAG: hypothetical protein ACJ8GK_07060 [Luteimonas sp.]